MLLLGRRDKGPVSIYSMGSQPSYNDRMLGENNFSQPDMQPSQDAFLEMAAEMLIEGVGSRDSSAVVEAFRTAFAALEMED